MCPTAFRLCSRQCTADQSVRLYRSWFYSYRRLLLILRPQRCRGWLPAPFAPTCPRHVLGVAARRLETIDIRISSGDTIMELCVLPPAHASLSVEAFPIGMGSPASNTIRASHLPLDHQPRIRYGSMECVGACLRSLGLMSYNRETPRGFFGPEAYRCSSSLIRFARLSN
jgi:hypothetical protein